MNWLKLKLRDWVNSAQDTYAADRDYKESRAMKMGIGISTVERGMAEGQDRISFDLSSAVGGRILNVRRYDPRKDHHENQTYVIPNGEDIGERVAKIINLEMFRG